jgi:hypothetical protein
MFDMAESSAVTAGAPTVISQTLVPQPASVGYDNRCHLEKSLLEMPDQCHCLPA